MTIKRYYSKKQLPKSFDREIEAVRDLLDKGRPISPHHVRKLLLIIDTIKSK